MAILALSDVNVVQQTLHGLGADCLDAVDKEGKTALMAASSKGHVESVKLLHAMKADVTICGENGTAMHYAVRGGHTEMLKVKLRHAHQTCILQFGPDLG